MSACGTPVAGLETPVAVVDLDVLHRNIGRMADLAAAKGVKLRPHAKTHKCPAIAHLQMRAGARGITVAKIGEAEAMAEAGMDDILIAYPLVGEGKMRRFSCLRQWVRRLACTVDSLAGARLIAAQVSSCRLVDEPVPVYIEVDTGLSRVGVAPGRPVVELAAAIAGLPGIRVTGILTHAGQAYGAKTDAELRSIADQEATLMKETALMLAEAGLPVQEVSIGSTPTCLAFGDLSGITEIRPGTYVFGDAALVRLGCYTVQDCALTVRATVVAVHGPQRVILDAGSKALSSDPPSGAEHVGFGLIKGHPGAAIERLYEEHAVARFQATAEGTGSPPAVGDAVEIIPNHVCPVVNLYDRLAVAQDGWVVASWAVSGRGRLQ